MLLFSTYKQSIVTLLMLFIIQLHNFPVACKHMDIFKYNFIRKLIEFTNFKLGILLLHNFYNSRFDYFS